MPKSLQIYYSITDKSFELTNDSSGLNKLLASLNKHYQSLADIIVVFEPTGGYEQTLRNFCKTHQLHFATVHPNKVRYYAKAKGWRGLYR